MITVKKGRDYDLLAYANGAAQEAVLRDALSRSIVYVARLDGTIAAAWGLIPPTVLSESAYVWLLTTPLAEQRKFLLVRYSQMFVEEMLKEHPMLIGDVILPNPSAVRWITWLGGEFLKPVGGRIPFVIRRKS